MTVISKNKIYCGDCLKFLKMFPDNSVDLIVTDPPYNISEEGKVIRRDYTHYVWRRQKDINYDFGEWDRQWRSFKEYAFWVEQWFKECARILKNKSWIYIFFDKAKITLLDSLATKYGLRTRNVFVWYKSNPVPSFRKANWINATEFIWVGSKGECKLRKFKQQKEMHNVFIHPNKSIYGETEHPTEKPVKLLEHLIECSSNEGDLVLDCFAGSGSTAVACMNLKRNFILIEQNENYYELIKKRLTNIGGRDGRNTRSKTGQ